MLGTACEQGLDAVTDAPSELAGFLAAMEQTPDWIDMALVEEGARAERNEYAHLVPLRDPGCVPRHLHEQLFGAADGADRQSLRQLAARRVHETATFFTLTVVPGALERHGPAFKAAAMVRLMHSMVRFNVMQRAGMWDARVYGVPIPQVDQMPAGQIGSFLIAFKALREGRETFTHEERARIEIARYRCFLLGLPKALLGETPREIAMLMLARQATLREAFDDATCGALVRGTLSTELSHAPSIAGRIDARLERSFSRAFFIRHFLQGDVARAKEMGVSYTLLDRKLALVAAARIFARLHLFDGLAAIPVVRDIADRHLVGKLGGLLKRYGHADFTSDASTYRAAHG